MDKINLEKEFPNIYKNLDENEKDLKELRYFIVINENYEDLDDEEVDIFDPIDYNYLVYITERLVRILGEDNLNQLSNRLEKKDYIQNFLIAEEDLYGVKSDLEEEKLGLNILKEAENILKDIKCD